MNRPATPPSASKRHIAALTAFLFTTTPAAQRSVKRAKKLKRNWAMVIKRRASVLQTPPDERNAASARLTPYKDSDSCACDVPQWVSPCFSAASFLSHLR